MIRRIFAFLVIIWIFGFVLFATTLPGPLVGPTGGAAIVPTGSAGRIARGLSLLAEHKVDVMLVTGVDPEVRREEFAKQFNVERKTMDCCVILGSQAVDTIGNAHETAAWVMKRKVKTVRLVTADWHMRRAHRELARVLPATVTVYNDAVRSEPSLRILLLEYHKLLASWVLGLGK